MDGLRVSPEQFGLDKEIQGLLHNGICNDLLCNVLIYPEGNRFFLMMTEFSRIRGSRAVHKTIAAIMFTSVVFGEFSQKELSTLGSAQIGFPRIGVNPSLNSQPMTEARNLKFGQ